MSEQAAQLSSGTRDYMTVTVGGQLLGFPVPQVHDVFRPRNLTRVPLAPPEVSGVLNMRGRIVTVIDMRRRLGLPERQDCAQAMAVGIERQGDSYGLLVDSIREVLRLPLDGMEAVPANLDRVWAGLALGVHRLDGGLLVILDVESVLDIGAGHDAA